MSQLFACDLMAGAFQVEQLLAIKARSRADDELDRGGKRLLMGAETKIEHHQRALRPVALKESLHVSEAACGLVGVRAQKVIVKEAEGQGGVIEDEKG